MTSRSEVSVIWKTWEGGDETWPPPCKDAVSLKYKKYKKGGMSCRLTTEEDQNHRGV